MTLRDAIAARRVELAPENEAGTESYAVGIDSDGVMHCTNEHYLDPTLGRYVAHEWKVLTDVRKAWMTREGFLESGVRLCPECFLEPSAAQPAAPFTVRRSPYLGAPRERFEVVEDAETLSDANERIKRLIRESEGPVVMWAVFNATGAQVSDFMFS